MLYLQIKDLKSFHRSPNALSKLKVSQVLYQLWFEIIVDIVLELYIQSKSSDTMACVAVSIAEHDFSVHVAVMFTKL